MRGFVYYGEPVAGVVATSEALAVEAVRLVEVDYEVLPAIFDPVEAAQPEAPLLHPDLGDYSVANFIFPEPGTNISEHFKIRKGDVETAGISVRLSRKAASDSLLLNMFRWKPTRQLHYVKTQARSLYGPAPSPLLPCGI